MSRLVIVIAALIVYSPQAYTQTPGESDAVETKQRGETDQDSQDQPSAPGTSSDQPKTLSGMSILGNEEAPKSLVIVPWKSSELGEDPSLTDTLDDRARPVDKEVFLRELSYYEIRSAE